MLRKISSNYLMNHFNIFKNCVVGKISPIKIRYLGNNSTGNATPERIDVADK